MQLHKSEKAKLELGSKARLLNIRERAALLLADGHKTRIEVQRLLQDDGSMLQKLIADGYLFHLKTTRMFLFDLCERMFVQKMPALAHQFRDQLREARDRESMLSIARTMISRVEEIAGSERADGLSERIAMLLPPEHQAGQLAPLAP